MADRAPIATRMAAARALTSAQTGSSPAATTPSASSGAAAGSTSGAAQTEPSTSTLSVENSGSAESDSNETIADASGGSSPDETESDSGSSSDASYGSDKERIDAAVLALEKGDLKAAVSALGRQVKLTHPETKAFAALAAQRQKHAARVKADQQKSQQTLGEIARAKHEIHQESVKVSNSRRENDQRYGWIGQTERAWDAGDMVTVAKSFERMCRGASLATITQRIANAHMGKSEPLTGEQQQLENGRAQLRKEQDDWNKRQAEEKANRDKEQGQRSLAEQRETALGKFGESHAKHPFLANPDDPEAPDPESLSEAFGAYEKAWNEWKAGKRTKPTPKQVLDELHGKEVRKLKRLGITPAAGGTVAAPPKAGTSSANGKVTAPKGQRLPEPPRTNGKPPSRDDTRASRIALAKKITEQQTRGMRA